MAVSQFRLRGLAPQVNLGKSGPLLSSSLGAVEVRNPSDSDYAIARAAPGVSANDVVTIGQLGGALFFGQGLLVQQKAGAQSTTSATFQLYDTFTILAGTLDPAGTYRIGVNWNMTATNPNTEPETRFVINGNPGPITVVEPSAADSLMPIAVVDYFSGSINALDIVIQLEYRLRAGSGSAGINGSLFEVWRAS